MVRMLSSADVQDLLGISRPTLYLWVRLGKLTPIRAGRSLLFEEDKIMILLGRRPSVAVWIASSVIEEARQQARRWSGSDPHFWMEYLDPPTVSFIRARVTRSGSGDPVSTSPSAPLFSSLKEAKRSGSCLILGRSEESIWMVHQVREEVSPKGESYLAVELTPAEDEVASRERRLDSVIEEMKSGLIRGTAIPYRREDLHERRPS